MGEINSIKLGQRTWFLPPALSYNLRNYHSRQVISFSRVLVFPTENKKPKQQTFKIL